MCQQVIRSNVFDGGAEAFVDVGEEEVVADLFDANGCWAVSNQPLNEPPLGRIVGTEPQLSGVKRHPTC